MHASKSSFSSLSRLWIDGKYERLLPMDSFPKYIEKKCLKSSDTVPLLWEKIWLQPFPYWFSFCYQLSDLLFLSYKRPSVRTFFSLVIVSYNWVGSSFLLSMALFFLVWRQKIDFSFLKEMVEKNICSPSMSKVGLDGGTIWLKISVGDGLIFVFDMEIYKYAHITLILRFSYT